MNDDALLLWSLFFLSTVWKIELQHLLRWFNIRKYLSLLFSVSCSFLFLFLFRFGFSIFYFLVSKRWPTCIQYSVCLFSFHWFMLYVRLTFWVTCMSTFMSLSKMVFVLLFFLFLSTLFLFHIHMIANKIRWSNMTFFISTWMKVIRRRLHSGYMLHSYVASYLGSREI